MMNKLYLVMFLFASFLFSCSSDDPDVEKEEDIAEKIIGGWQLDRIRVEGPDCKLIFGDNVPEEYLADEEGCATPNEILGNASRCVNVIFSADGEGTFLWSEITSQEDAPITYTIVDNEVEYCFEGSFCSSSYSLVNGNLESVAELRLDQVCNAVFVLRPK